MRALPASRLVGYVDWVGDDWLTKGYFAGYSIDSTARSMSRSGQYRWWGLGIWTFAICRTAASRNHGNSLNGTNISRSPMNSQNPWGETLVTSTGEVFRPSASDFIEVFFNQGLRLGQPARIQTEIHGEFNRRFDPELRFAVRVLHVDVRSPLLREKK
jgi:hypothetical protein